MLIGGGYSLLAHVCLESVCVCQRFNGLKHASISISIVLAFEVSIKVSALVLEV